jgi:hypothetical protein
VCSSCISLIVFGIFSIQICVLCPLATLILRDLILKVHLTLPVPGCLVLHDLLIKSQSGCWHTSYGDRSGWCPTLKFLPRRPMWWHQTCPTLSQLSDDLVSSPIPSRVRENMPMGEKLPYAPSSSSLFFLCVSSYDLIWKFFILINV